MIRPANPSFQWGVRGVRRYIRMENKKENMETMRSYKFRIYPDQKRAGSHRQFDFNVPKALQQAS